jgi:hypothetical protein
MGYSIDLHNHRLAAWAASTAARASKLCRFPVRDGIAILEDAGFSADFGLKELPSPEDLSSVHKEWREAVLEAATSHDLAFTHGVAAKLVNCYLKVRFVCGGYHEDNRVACLHPPVDRVLLEGLIAADVGGHKKEWKRLKSIAWSKFSSDEYEEVIDLIDKSISGAPLWTIEEYWGGHQ